MAVYTDEIFNAWLGNCMAGTSTNKEISDKVT